MGVTLDPYQIPQPRCSVWDSSSQVSNTYNMNTPLTITGVTGAGTAVQPKKKENTKESRHCGKAELSFSVSKDIAPIDDFWRSRSL